MACQQVASTLVFFVLLVSSGSHAQSVQFPNVVTIGAILSTQEHGEFFMAAIEKANNELIPTLPLPEGFHLNYTFTEMNENPIRTANDVCSDIIPSQPYVVIASHHRQSSLSTTAISFTCGFYKIPVIGITARESTFSDKVSLCCTWSIIHWTWLHSQNVHCSFMRTVPPYSDQAEAWAELMKFFAFKRIIIIHSSDQEGRAMLGKFQSKAETKDIEVNFLKS